jgi:hypothetical protein
MKFYVPRLVDCLPNAVRQTKKTKHIKPFLLWTKPLDPNGSRGYCQATNFSS